MLNKTRKWGKPLGNKNPLKNEQQGIESSLHTKIQGSRRGRTRKTLKPNHMISLIHSVVIIGPKSSTNNHTISDKASYNNHTIQYKALKPYQMLRTKSTKIWCIYSLSTCYECMSQAGTQHIQGGYGIKLQTHTMRVSWKTPLEDFLEDYIFSLPIFPPH